MKIQIEHYNKTIRRHQVLEDVSATFVSGHVYGLYGRNGSGKSMLLRAISGLIRPTSGKIMIDDKTLGVDFDFSESLGLIIESVRLQPSFTAQQNLEILRDIRKTASDEDIRWALDAVGLADSSQVKVREFSLGMNQKLAIAQAIFEHPAILLLDEPTNALDFQSVREFQDLIAKLRDPDRIIIVASHAKEDLLTIADQFLEMDAGHLSVRQRDDLAMLA
ncbi:ATP-binding cassette domain-containing protein [Lacticaseibacillus mingshuiensis]|uniref:ATP-binding cassette domain-containing protein n=1 Tax=Lacticaseibacillus mingshuiensis TaxID=2799574 RepID=A0ABW4CJX0_9LACO|nr:ABC transporter ATP-binding protein [Lacticaseibacillus mingshuiensis]